MPNTSVTPPMRNAAGIDIRLLKHWQNPKTQAGNDEILMEAHIAARCDTPE